MQVEIFLAAVTVHLVTHYLKNFWITRNGTNGEELQHTAPYISDSDESNKANETTIHQENAWNVLRRTPIQVETRQTFRRTFIAKPSTAPKLG